MVSSLTHASIGGEIGKVAVENNYLSLKDVSAYQRALKKAIQNGESVEEVHKHFKALSEKQRAMLLETCDIDCRVTVPNELLAAIGFADDLSGVVNSWVRGLPLEEQTQFYQLVEAENIKTIQALKAKQGSVEKGVELAMDMARFFAKEETIGSSSAKKSLYDPSRTTGNINIKERRSTPNNFANQQKLDEHFEKHHKEFGKIYSSSSEYLDGARDVIKNGYKVSYQYKGENRDGYVLYMGNTKKGESKFAFVGTNNREITTYHIESGKDFWKMLNGDKNMKIIKPVNVEE